YRLQSGAADNQLSANLSDHLFVAANICGGAHFHELAEQHDIGKAIADAAQSRLVRSDDAVDRCLFT
ncbi:MAG: hypothetical protein ACREBW_06135, partial [Candidatus Micrarchaeaceae archaeon]